MFLPNELRHLVNDFGHTITYRKKSLGTYNPSLGAMSGSSNTDYTTKAYIYNYNLEEMSDKIVLGDRKVVFQRYDTSNTELPEPAVGDQVISHGDTTSIVSVAKILDRGVVACYICQVRE